MKPFNFGQPPADVPEWLRRLAQEIENDSNVDAEAIMREAFSVTGSWTPTRSLDVDTATLPDLLAFIATLITDIQTRGQRG
jgi:hypothetical protein